MKAATTHSATLHGWLSPSHRIEGFFDADSSAICHALAYTKQGPGERGYYEAAGYTYIGVAQIAVEIPAVNDLIASKVKSLENEEREVLAKAQARSTEIRGQIQNLLAISFDGASS